MLKMLEQALTTGAVATAMLAVIGVLVALLRLWRGFNRFMVTVNDFLSDWNGELREGTKSMPDRVAALERDVTEIRHQVTPNGGETRRLGDRVVRIEDLLGIRRSED